jgi:hypothetical protein
MEEAELNGITGQAFSGRWIDTKIIIFGILRNGQVHHGRQE